jgi:hypothetical protein
MESVFVVPKLTMVAPHTQLPGASRVRCWYSWLVSGAPA